MLRLDIEFEMGCQVQMVDCSVFEIVTIPSILGNVDALVQSEFVFGCCPGRLDSIEIVMLWLRIT